MVNLLTALVQTPAKLGDHQQMPAFIPIEELFSGWHFDREIIVLCVRWYLSFKLSYRDLVMMMVAPKTSIPGTTLRTR
jgi:hypothetical protein